MTFKQSGQILATETKRDAWMMNSNQTQEYSAQHQQKQREYKEKIWIDKKQKEKYVFGQTLLDILLLLFYNFPYRCKKAGIIQEQISYNLVL